jgi:hypothetical protein
MKNSSWRKAFKSVEAMNKWVDQNDAEVHGTRDIDKTRSYSYNKPTRSAAKDVRPVGDEFHVVVKGGSIGSSGPHVTSTHATREEAAEKAKRMNKLLSPGEKKYYGLGYSVKEQGK